MAKTNSTVDLAVDLVFLCSAQDGTKPVTPEKKPPLKPLLEAAAPVVKPQALASSPMITPLCRSVYNNLYRTYSTQKITVGFEKIFTQEMDEGNFAFMLNLSILPSMNLILVVNTWFLELIMPLPLMVD